MSLRSGFSPKPAHGNAFFNQVPAAPPTAWYSRTCRGRGKDLPVKVRPRLLLSAVTSFPPKLSPAPELSLHPMNMPHGTAVCGADLSEGPARALNTGSGAQFKVVPSRLCTLCQISWGVRDMCVHWRMNGEQMWSIHTTWYHSASKKMKV